MMAYLISPGLIGPQRCSSTERIKSVAQPGLIGASATGKASIRSPMLVFALINLARSRLRLRFPHAPNRGTRGVVLVYRLTGPACCG